MKKKKKKKKIVRFSWPFSIFTIKMNLPFAPEAYKKFGWDICWNELSYQQIWVVEQRTQGFSVSEICKLWKQRWGTESELGHLAYEHCIICAALGLFWEKGMITGKRPYLCDSDLCALESILTTSVSEEEYLEPDQVPVRAFELRKCRVASAFSILDDLGHPKLAEKINTEFSQPSRQWINIIATKINSHLIKPSNIETERYLFGNPDVINSFFDKHETLISNTPPCLLFGADETKLEPSISKKVLVHHDLLRVIKNGIPNMPHISAMCAHNAIGTAVPLFIILKDLQNLPNELKDFSETGQAWFGSSRKGFMTRDLFLQWCVHFINWLSMYRLTLDESVRHRKALLIMDGHHSRENPFALMLMAANDIEVLILPSHVTHILQMFDVGLASPMKAKFSSLFRCFLKSNIVATSAIAKVRRAAIHAIISAWSSVCIADNCVAAAAKTGMLPCARDVVLSNPYVRVLTGENLAKYQRRVEYLNVHWTIGNNVITEPEAFVKVVDLVSNSENHRYLCCARYPSYVCRDNFHYYTLNAKFCLNLRKNGCVVFSRPPPFVMEGKIPFHF